MGTGYSSVFPVELQIAKGGAELGPRYVLNVGQTLTAISVNHSKINWGSRADGSKWAYPPAQMTTWSSPKQ